MKNAVSIVLVLLTTTAAFGQKKTAKAEKIPEQPAIELKTGIDSASYAYGMLLGDQIKTMMGKVYNTTILVDALNATMRGDKTVYTKEGALEVYQQYMQLVQEKAAEVEKAEGEASKAASEKFLEENKKRPGVMTTASGLQYEILVKGTGTVMPSDTDLVKVHYHGTTIDGEVFDSSVDRNEPVSFGLNEVISGWTEGVQLMRVGDKFKFFIPADLAYGERSPTPAIKPYAVLIFEIELLEINPEE